MHSARDEMSLEFVKDFIAGGLAGVAQVASSYPLDTIKTRLQGERDSGKLRAGVVDTLRKTLRYEGVRGLFKGMAAPVAGISLLNSGLFAANERFKRDLQRMRGGATLTVRDIATAGMLAGVVQSVAASPVELIKTKLQMQFVHADGAANATNRRYAGPIDCVRQVYAAGGLRGVFKGYGCARTVLTHQHFVWILIFGYQLHHTVSR